MDVFLVPVAPDRYELYCEEPDEPARRGQDAPPAGILPPPGASRSASSSRRRSAQRRRGARSRAEARPSLFGRVKHRDPALGRRVDCRAAPALAAPRQGCRPARVSRRRHRAAGAPVTAPLAAARLGAPPLLAGHRQLGALGSIALILLPGPNFIGYYFLFRIVGHYLSLRGARQGLVGVTWTARPAPALATLRTLVGDAPDARAERCTPSPPRSGSSTSPASFSAPRRLSDEGSGFTVRDDPVTVNDKP